MSSSAVHAGTVLQAWGRILRGYQPNLSVEITRECPLRCPGCYAYGDEHFGKDVTLRGLADYTGAELVSRVRDAAAKRVAAIWPSRRRPLAAKCFAGVTANVGSGTATTGC
jgi:hypothetical protein